MSPEDRAELEAADRWERACGGCVGALTKPGRMGDAAVIAAGRELRRAKEALAAAVRARREVSRG